MSNTDLTFDPATSGTTWVWGPKYVWSDRTTAWYPVIQGAQDDPPSGDSGTPPGGDDSGATSGGKDDDSGSGDDKGKSFSQEEVNAILAREVSQAKRGKLDPKELGFDSASDLKEFLETSKQAQEAAKTDSEKAIEEARTNAEKAAREEVYEEAVVLVMRAEFMMAAMRHDVEYPEDAFELVQMLDSWDAVEIDDKGVVKGLDDALFADLKKAKPFLFKQPTSSDIGAGARDSGGTSDDDLVKKFPALGSAWRNNP